MSTMFENIVVMLVLLNPFLVVVYLIDVVKKLPFKKFSGIIIQAGIFSLIVFVLFALIEGAGIIAYIIAWIIIPERTESTTSRSEEEVYDVDFEGEDEEGEYKAKEETPEEEKKSKEQRKRILGLILVALGIFFILDSWIPGFYWRRFWPVVLIVLGVVLIYREVRER